MREIFANISNLRLKMSLAGCNRLSGGKISACAFYYDVRFLNNEANVKVRIIAELAVRYLCAIVYKPRGRFTGRVRLCAQSRPAAGAFKKLTTPFPRGEGMGAKRFVS
jgi:hypothetical protein